MMTDAEIIARAIGEAEGLHWNDTPSFAITKKILLIQADAAIAALTEAGLAIRPREPTAACSSVGAKVLRDNMDNANFAARARELYIAMMREIR